MGYMGNAIIEMAEAGAVMADPAEVAAWRRQGHDVPLRWVEIDTYRGRQPMPAIDLEVAMRLAESLDDEAARHSLRQAIEDARGCLPDGRLYKCDQCGRLGLHWFFVRTSHDETFCLECA
jgi:hypothetical protein